MPPVDLYCPLLSLPHALGTEADTLPQSVPYLQLQNGLVKCLDVAGQVSGSTVQQFTCNGTVNQQWTKQPTDNGWFRLSVASSGRCLEVEGASQEQNHLVQIADCNGAFNQQWNFRSSGFGDDTRILVARHSGLCLDIVGHLGADRTPAMQFGCDGNLADQRWRTS